MRHRYLTLFVYDDREEGLYRAKTIISVADTPHWRLTLTRLQFDAYAEYPSCVYRGRELARDGASPALRRRLLRFFTEGGIAMLRNRRLTHGKR